MRPVMPCMLILLSPACEEPSFDQRYEQTAGEIEDRAQRLDNDLEPRPAEAAHQETER